MKRLGAHLVVAAAVLTAAAHGLTAGEARVFGLPAALTSADAVGRAIESAVADGFDTLQAPLHLAAGIDTRGTAFDPLDEVIRQAQQRRLRVHAVVTVGLAAPGAALPAARDHIVYQHPEWLMIPRALGIQLRDMDPRHPAYLGGLMRWARANSPEGIYLSPVYPEAAAYLTTALGRALRRYAVDEVTLDLRAPGSDFDYSPRALDVFRAARRPTLSPAERRRMDEVEQIDPFAWAEEYPVEWMRFQRERWDSLLATLRGVAAVERPGTVVTATLTVAGSPGNLPAAATGAR
jgi:uncharacterized lipoprotein YddW (UPF0748 family)